MRTHVAWLLVIAAACAPPASAGVRWELFNRHVSDQWLSNTTITPPAGDVTRSLSLSMPPSSTTFTLDLSSSSPSLAGSVQDINTSIAIDEATTTLASTSMSTSTSSSSSTSSRPIPASASSALTTLASQPTTIHTTSSTSTTATSSEGNPRISANSVNGPGLTPISATTSTGDISSGQGSSSIPPPTYWSSSLSLWNTTYPVTTSTRLTSTSNTKTCTDLQDVETVTEFSIVYTSTTTLYGNYSTYTPPYPTIETPNYCGTEPVVPSETTWPGEPMLTTLSGGFVVSTKRPASSCLADTANSDCWEPAGPAESTSTETYRGKHPPSATLSRSRVTVTFVTTDKNPVVVSSTDLPPDYSESGKAASLTVAHHKSAPPDGDSDHSTGGGGGGGDGDQNDPQSQQQEVPETTATIRAATAAATASVAATATSVASTAISVATTIASVATSRTTITTSFTVTARAGQVIINDKTFSGLKPDQTTTVTFSIGTFTIFPSSVVGEGATITKPQPVGTAISIATPTTSSVGDLAVEVSGSEAIVDGTKIAILPQGTTTVINNEEVSVGPGKVVVGDQTLTFRAAGGPETAVVIQGGEMVTAIGQSIYVFHSTTLTYGPGTPETSEVVDDDTITIGPSGITLHGTTIGGPGAEATDTTYEIVGGASVTKLAPSNVIIDGTTFTAGPGSKPTTKIIGGETVTIGSKGVVISSMTLSIPFGSSTVTTITATVTGTQIFPEETGTSGDSESSNNDQSNDDEGSAGSALKPGFSTGMAGLCIAIGVWVWL